MSKLKIKVILLVFIVLILMPVTFASENQSDISADINILATEYCEDIVENNDSYDVLGSNPYEKLTPDKIKKNSILYVENGEYNFNTDKVVDNVTLIGESTEKTIIKNAVFVANRYFTIKNLTLINCHIDVNNSCKFNAFNSIFKDSSSKTGGAITSYSNANLILSGCIFEGNYADDYGGSIYARKTKITISDSTFKYNSAQNWGGAISIEDNSNLILSNSKFLNNYALSDAGGAIYSVGSKIVATDLSIYNSNATFGAAITSLNSNLNLNRFNASNNKVKYEGGAVYVFNGVLSIMNSILNNNTAKDGGALFVDVDSGCKIVSNKFLNNHAEDTGGACYLIVPQLTKAFSLNKFENNIACCENNVFETTVPDVEIGDGDYILIQYNSSFNGTIPGSYDLRKLNQVTPVKHQFNGGNCWAFAALASLESCILKAGGPAYDFSEENMKNLMCLYSDYGWDVETNDGGFDEMGEGYLVSWLGPVNESDDAYNDYSLLSPMLHSFIHVQDIIFLKRDSCTDNDEIKKAVMEYGAVATGIYWGFDEYIKDSINYYYPGDIGPNHAIVIVGWDDNYSKDNFKDTPEGDGAWIIKNSWGSKAGEGGYFYVSYYDESVVQIGEEEMAYTFMLNNTIKFDKNYQYDIAGVTSYLSSSGQEVWYKNRFTATDNEYLTAVSTYFKQESEYELYIYVNDELKLTQKGNANPSYSTINLDQFIQLNKEDIFEVVFKLKVDDTDVGVPICEKYSINRLIYDANSSFIGYDGVHWDDLYNYMGDTESDAIVACIKTFTVLNKINTSLDLEVIKNNSYADIIARVYNQYGFSVNSGNVVFTVDGKNYTVKVVNGVAEYSKALLKDGINNFSAQFNCEGYNTSHNSALVSNNPLKTYMNLNFIDLGYDPIKITANIFDENNKAVKSGQVTFTVEGENYTVDVIDGVASINHYFQKGGMCTVSAYYDDLYCYNPVNVQNTWYINFINTKTTLTLSGDSNPMLITAKVVDVNGNPVKSGQVTFAFPSISKNFTFDLVNGEASFEHIFTKLGSMDIYAYYNDVYRYSYSMDYKYVYLNYKNSFIDLEFDNNYNPVTITAKVHDGEGNCVDAGNVTFTLENTQYNVKLVNGAASLSHTFSNMGMNTVYAYYSGSYIYSSQSNQSTVNIKKIPVSLSFDISNNLNNVSVNVILSKDIQENINLYVNDKCYVTKSKNRIASFSLNNLNEGVYSLKANISSDNYEYEEISDEFKIINYSTKLIADDIEAYYSNVNYSVKLLDNYNNAVKNAAVTITCGDKTFTGKTNSQGIAQFDLNLDVGNHELNISYAGDNNHISSLAKAGANVKSTFILPTKSVYTYNAKYVATLLDRNGNPLSNAQVTLLIGSNSYNVKTNSKGELSSAIYLSPIYYMVSITNPSSSEVATQNIKVVKRISGNSDLTMYFGAGKYYKVRVYDDDGKIAKKVKVTFKINGKSYTRTTNDNGYASFKITLVAGTYTITAAYKDFTVKNKIVVKPTIVTKNIAVKKGKTIKFTAKLLNNKGKILKSKKITFKFKGKTYKIKTNSKGIATLKIKNSYKIGKYVIYSIYGKAKIKNTINIKK